MKLRKRGEKKDLEENRPTLSKSEYVEDGWHVRPPKGYRFEITESNPGRLSFKVEPE